MKNFEGKKWRCVKSEMVRDESVWWADEYIEKNTFAMTRQYAKYLAEKRKLEAQEYLKVLKSKLEYQYKMFGEVDDVDFKEYLYMTDKYHRDFD